MNVEANLLWEGEKKAVTLTRRVCQCALLLIRATSCTPHRKPWRAWAVQHWFANRLLFLRMTKICDDSLTNFRPLMRTVTLLWCRWWVWSQTAVDPCIHISVVRGEGFLFKLFSPYLLLDQYSSKELAQQLSESFSRRRFHRTATCAPVPLLSHSLTQFLINRHVTTVCKKRRVDVHKSWTNAEPHEAADLLSYWGKQSVRMNVPRAVFVSFQRIRWCIT